MKVRKQVKPVKMLRSNLKLKILKKNKGKNIPSLTSLMKNKKSKMKNILLEDTSLIVKMDTSAETLVPSLIENIDRQEDSDANNGQHLSGLVSSHNLKSRNSSINRLPYKQEENKKIINTGPTLIEPVIKDTLGQSIEVDGLEFHILNDSKVMLLMSSPLTLYFNGSLKIQVLMGSVEVLGYQINHSTGMQTIYSTRGSSHNCLKAVASTQSLINDKCFASGISIIDQFLSPRMKDLHKRNILSKLSEKSIIIILHRNKDILYSEIWPKFLFDNCSFYSVFPQSNDSLKSNARTFSTVEHILNCLFELNYNTKEAIPKKYRELIEWNKVEEEVILKTNHISPKTVLIGGKSVGKSTFLRYMVNKSLKKWKEILVLDFDIGQSEFTVPGCVSAVLVEKPLLGTNFTHLMDPVRSVFVGDINAVNCLESYMEGFQQVLNFCKEQPMLQNIPWLVNTMGFCKALGFSITASIIQQVTPTHVVQIHSCDKSKNFEKQLKPQVVSKHSFGKYTRPHEALNYTFLYIPSAAEDKGGKNVCSVEWGMPPKESRQLVLFSYLSQMLTPQSLNLLEVVPYMVNISRLDLRVSQSRMLQNQALVVMNGNLVALCNSNKNKQELPNCLGFGIVRGIDFDKDQLFLITPLELSKLQNVNCLVKGDISLPESFILDTKDNIENHVPYVTYTSKAHTTLPAKREYKPNKLNAGTHIKSY